LRLAVLFRRARRAESLPQMQLAAGARALRLKLPPAWVEQHPLTEADLQQEKAPMAELGVKLDISGK
jgi:exopolyphosphatase/guanosine-5'-triphosphate,3'-diphosphate pyrophosphatase